MLIHLLDGTYELFRHFYGLRRFTKEDRPFGGVVGVLNTVLQMVEAGGTHFGVATDHVIESFRNDLWADYKTGEGIEPNLLAQFHPLEEALGLMGIAVWPMIELEADDALASAARIAAADARVQRVCIWTPDKDLAQCVQDDRVVQVHRKTNQILDAGAVRQKYGVDPLRIPDFLALEDFPPEVLGERKEQAVLFKELATLRTDARLFADVEELRWRGPTDSFTEYAARLGDERLQARLSAVRSRQ